MAADVDICIRGGSRKLRFMSDDLLFFSMKWKVGAFAQVISGEIVE